MEKTKDLRLPKVFFFGAYLKSMFQDTFKMGSAFAARDAGDAADIIHFFRGYFTHNRACRFVASFHGHSAVSQVVGDRRQFIEVPVFHAYRQFHGLGVHR
jgi:hypothetical protein